MGFEHVVDSEYHRKVVRVEVAGKEKGDNRGSMDAGK